MQSTSFYLYDVTVGSLEKIDRDQLLSFIENLIEEIKLLKLDNVLNERFLRKNDEELLNGILTEMDTENRKPKIQFAESVSEHQNESGVPHTISRDISFAESISRASSISSLAGSRARKPTNLSFVVKSNICQSESDLERASLGAFEHMMKAKFIDLLAEIEEIKLTTQDVRYAADMFQDFVIEKGNDFRRKFLWIRSNGSLILNTIEESRMT